MWICPAPSRLSCLAGLSVGALAPRQAHHALAFSSPAPAVSKVNHGHHETVRNLNLSRRRRGSGSASTPRGPLKRLTLNLSQGGDGVSDGGTQTPGGWGGGGEEGGDFRESGPAEGDSLLAGQAQEALEFWKNRQPSPTLPPTHVIGLLMAALQKNDDPSENEGLRTVFEFSSGMCRRAVGGTADSFIKGARFSVFGATVGCQSFSLDPMQMVGDRLATQVVSVVASDGRQRRFLWTLEQQRRPAGRREVADLRGSELRRRRKAHHGRLNSAALQAALSLVLEGNRDVRKWLIFARGAYLRR